MISKDSRTSDHRMLSILVISALLATPSFVSTETVTERSSLTLVSNSEELPTGMDLLAEVVAGDLEGVKRLFETGVDFGAMEGNILGEALTYAASDGYVDIVEYLLEIGADPNGVPEWERPWGKTLSAAGENNHVDIINILLDAGATVASRRFGPGVMDKAAENGQLEAVLRLLEAGADPNDKDDGSLKLAAENGHVDIVDVLIKSGADVNARKGEAIKHAAMNGQLDAIRILIEAGVTPENLGNALEEAAQEGQYDAVKLFLERGADPRIGYPLLMAAKNGHLGVIHLLVEYGADINQTSDKVFWWDRFSGESGVDYGIGWTAMHMAAAYGQPLTEELLDLGADLNFQDAKGRTPLQTAVYCEKPVIAKDILKFCPDMTITDKEGKTAIDIAEDVARRPMTDSSDFRVLMNTLEEYLPEKIATTPSNEKAMNALKWDIKSILENDKALNEQLKNVRTDEYAIAWTIYYLTEERGRKQMPSIVEGHRCQGFIGIGSEFVVKCRCLPGQGPKITYTPVKQTRN